MAYDPATNAYRNIMTIGISVIAASSIITACSCWYYLREINQNLKELNKSNRIIIERLEKISPLEKEVGK